MSTCYDESEMDRVPTFIPMDVEATERRHSRPNSAKLSTSGENVAEQSVSSDSLNDDIAEYVRMLINKVLLQLTEQTSPRRPEREEEEPFSSPTISNETELEEQPFQSPVSGEGKGEEYYTPRSDDGDKVDNKSPRVAQADFEMAEDTGSFEFALMDIPIQEDPESPVRYSLSAQLLEEIDETLNSILNLEGSDDEDGYSVDEIDSSLLIDYSAEIPLEQAIAECAYYNTSRVDENSIPQEEPKQVGSPDRNEYPMTADIEDTFNVLLEMTFNSGLDEVPETLGAYSLSSADISDDFLLRAGLSDLEDNPGTNLRKSIKTPDVTQFEEPPMDTNPRASNESTDDEDENRGFVIMNDSEIKESLLHYEKFKKRLLNEKKSAKLEDVQPVIVEMENKEPEEARSYEEMPFRCRSPVRPVRKSRARSFFRRAASALGLIKTQTWSPATRADSYRVKAEDDDGIEVITTSFGGEPCDYVSSNTIPRPTAHKHDKFESMSEIAESVDQDMVKSSLNLPNRRILNRFNGTQSLPRSAGRNWNFFKIHK